MSFIGEQIVTMQNTISDFWTSQRWLELAWACEAIWLDGFMLDACSWATSLASQFWIAMHRLCSWHRTEVEWRACSLDVWSWQAEKCWNGSLVSWLAPLFDIQAHTHTRVQYTQKHMHLWCFTYSELAQEQLWRMVSWFCTGDKPFDSNNCNLQGWVFTWSCRWLCCAGCSFWHWLFAKLHQLANFTM